MEHGDGRVRSPISSKRPSTRHGGHSYANVVGRNGGNVHSARGYSAVNPHRVRDIAQTKTQAMVVTNGTITSPKNTNIRVLVSHEIKKQKPISSGGLNLTNGAKGAKLPPQKVNDKAQEAAQ